MEFQYQNCDRLCLWYAILIIGYIKVVIYGVPGVCLIGFKVKHFLRILLTLRPQGYNHEDVKLNS